MNRNQRIPATETQLTSEGWIYLIILAFISVGAVLRNVNLLILMAGMMIAPLLINWRLGAYRAKTLTARRSLPFRVHARQLVSLQWLCFNQSSLAAWGIEIYDTLKFDSRRQPGSQSKNTGSESADWDDDNQIDPPFLERLKQSLIAATGLRKPEAPAYNLRLELASIGGQQQQVASGRVFFPQRGAYRFGPAKLVTQFPFGLIVTRVYLNSREMLYVAPQTGILTPVWHRRVRSIIAGSDALLKRRGLEGDDFYALRRWRSGDSQKLIHWRTSAKHGYPIVKQFEQPDNRDFAMLLDLFVADDPDVSGQDCIEACEAGLSFATTVLLNIGDAVKGRMALAICGEQTAILPSRSQRELVERAMPCLATARPTATPEIATSLLALTESVSNSTPIIVISSRPRMETAALLRGSDSMLSQRLKHVLPALVWITVGSPEFNDMFCMTEEDQELKTLVSKWGEHVPH